MIRINCPYCGERDHSEFTYGGDGSIKYPALDAPLEDWLNAVFQRENIRGVQTESWHHVNGCRMWLLVERDTMTHEIHSVRVAHPGLKRALGEKALEDKS
jgi:methylglutamate dehydrogenase subunit B